MADSASYADCEQRVAAQRSRWERANEHVAALKSRGGGDTARRKNENILRISRSKPGRRPVEIGSSLPGPGRRRVGLESHRPGRAWAHDSKVSRAGPWYGLGRARSARPGSAPPARVGPPTRTDPRIQCIGFFQIENIAKRDLKRDISAIFVRNEMS